MRPQGPAIDVVGEGSHGNIPGFLSGQMLVVADGFPS
jgi:hypothetical protein